MSEFGIQIHLYNFQVMQFYNTGGVSSKSKSGKGIIITMEIYLKQKVKTLLKHCMI